MIIRYFLFDLELENSLKRRRNQRPQNYVQGDKFLKVLSIIVGIGRRGRMAKGKPGEE
jgi:hypothetical protein